MTQPVVAGDQQRLYRAAEEWDLAGSDALRGQSPPTYQELLDEVFFHADLRFRDHLPGAHDGAFGSRLLAWLENVDTPSDRQTMLQMVLCILFISEAERRALYREAARRYVLSWLADVEELPAAAYLDSGWYRTVRQMLREYPILSVTESFEMRHLMQSDLAFDQVPRPLQLMPDPQATMKLALSSFVKPAGAIVVEDFVGSGDQATKALRAVVASLGDGAHILFVPLVALERGLSALAEESELAAVEVNPVVVVPNSDCVQETPAADESLQWKEIRDLVNRTSSLVLDDCDGGCGTRNSFGYKGCGALVVPCYNTPNNTLLMIHRASASWRPLFRRLEHA